MVQSQLPILDIAEERMLLAPQAVLDLKAPADATWEDRDFIKN